MKKLLALTLSVLMLVSIIPFGASAIEVEQVTGSSNAHDVLKAAIEKGTDGLSGTAWSVEGGSSVSEMKSISAAAVGSFKVRKNTDVWHDFEPQSSPDAYAYSYDSNNKSYLLSIAAYEQSESFKLKDGYGGKIPQSGILIRHSDLWTNKYLALTYTAEKDGKIQIYDPTGAEITAVSAVNDISNTGVFDVGAGSDGVYSKRGTLTVYKNGTVLWTKKLNANSRHFAWPKELKNIQVNAGDKISIVTGDIVGMPGALLAMNPQIDYIETAEKPDSAYLCLSEALRLDKNAGSTEAIENSRWHVALGSGESELLPTALGAPASPFRVLNYGDWKTYTPYSSVYGYSNVNGAHGILPYSLEADGIELKDYTGAVTAPPKGVLINTGRASVRLTYVAVEDGKMHLYDADGGNISVVQHIGTANTCSVPTVKAKILLNDVSVWDNDGTVFTAAAFPDLKLDVRGGDKVEIIIEKVGSGADMCVALNPTADYSEKKREIGDITDDGNIDILDMIKLKKLISDQKYDIYADLDGDSSLNTTDLAVMRKYLLGIIDEFPVNQVKKKITSLKTTTEKTYMVKGEEALPFYGVYIRADQIAADRLETYFEKAAELGFQTVIVPIKWWWIENEMDVFDFSKVDTVYSYLEKYGLDVQLLWYGSDNCGYYYDNVPAYVRNNTADYPLITRNGAKALNYSNPLLVAREARAVAALMNHIADIDTNRRLVSIQLENEANSCLPGSGDSITSTTAAAVAEAMHFVGGQKKAILNLVNQLGLAVKASRYPCVTRFGFASYSCYNKWSTAKLDTASEVLALDGIDAVGTNGFEPNTAMDTAFLENNVGQSENLPHIAEAPAGYASIFNKVLNAFSLGGGMLLYQLNETGINGGNKNKALSIYDTSADFTERNGTDSFVWNGDTYYYAATSDWKAFNGMIKAVGSRIADTAVKDNFKVIDAMSENKTENLTVGGKNFSYSTSGKPDNSYGTVGFIMQNTDGSYLLYSLKGGTTFTLPEGARVSSGRYVGDEWKSDNTISLANNNEFTVTSGAAVDGTVYRVTF